jgi:hypothetical protein
MSVKLNKLIHFPISLLLNLRPLTGSTRGESLCQIANSHHDVNYHTLKIPTLDVALRGSSVALRAVLPPFTQLMRVASNRCRRLGATVTAETGFCVCDSDNFNVNYTLHPRVVGRLFSERVSSPLLNRGSVRPRSSRRTVGLVLLGRIICYVTWTLHS